MNIHYLQHVPFEGLSSIEPVLINNGHQLSVTHLYLNETLPALDEFDWLIVMGGPMGIYDHHQYPWLSAERTFIKSAIEQQKKILGICLGAQFIADALGAKVYKNQHKEIGWFELKRSNLEKTILADQLPETFNAFHWHGDTFDLPQGAVHLCQSEACLNQGFIYDNRVIGLQFHLETTLESATALIENCTTDLDQSAYVQTADTMLADLNAFKMINQQMLTILTALEQA